MPHPLSQTLLTPLASQVTSAAAAAAGYYHPMASYMAAGQQGYYPYMQGYMAGAHVRASPARAQARCFEQHRQQPVHIITEIPMSSRQWHSE